MRQLILGNFFMIARIKIIVKILHQPLHLKLNKLHLVRENQHEIVDHSQGIDNVEEEQEEGKRL